MLYKIQENIEACLKRYDMVLLLEGEGGGIGGEFLDMLLNSQALCQSGRKILVLPEKSCKELSGLYRTYEFSDRIRIIGRSGQYGSLLNLVDNGLLTEQEAHGLLLQ